MKKILYILIVCLSFGSCTNDINFSGNDDDNEPIDYSVYNYSDNANYLSSSGANKWIFEAMASNYFWDYTYDEKAVNAMDFTLDPYYFFYSILEVPSSKIGRAHV